MLYCVKKVFKSIRVYDTKNHVKITGDNTSKNPTAKINITF